MESKIMFAYWDIRGRASPIRHLLEYLELKYEDKRITTEEW
jgi:hypothetical protein